MTHFLSSEGDRVVEYKIDKKRAKERTVTGDEFNRIHISDQNIPEPILYRYPTSSLLLFLSHLIIRLCRIVVVDGHADVEEQDVSLLTLSKKVLSQDSVFILDCDTEVF